MKYRFVLILTYCFLNVQRTRAPAEGFWRLPTERQMEIKTKTAGGNPRDSDFGSYFSYKIYDLVSAVRRAFDIKI